MKKYRPKIDIVGRILRLMLACLVLPVWLAGCAGVNLGGAKSDAATEAGAGAGNAADGAAAGEGLGNSADDVEAGAASGSGQVSETGAGTSVTGKGSGKEAGAGSGDSAPPAGWTPTLMAIITSDLHYDNNVRFSVFPLMQHIDEIAEIMADEVISRHPDVFIMTGDNTNSGAEDDVKALAAILARIHAAGIEVIVTTGNHDFDKGHLWEPYDGLCTAVSRDEETESLVVDLGGYRFLAMDDNAVENWVGGMLPDSTQAWMEEALETENEVIFLSHHNVLPGGEESMGSTYVIQLPGLRDLLADAGVRVCLSGHRHTQEILRYREMYEIISSPLASAPHQFGVLEIGGGWYRYHTEILDLGMDLLTEEVAGSDGRTENIAASADFTGRRQFKQDRILSLFNLFMDCVARGTLADRREEILENDCYGDMLDAFENTNYGPWIIARMEEAGLPGNRLVIAPKE